jgi:hypothetical protein
MSKIIEFKVGLKFKYIGNTFKKEINRTQEVLQLITMNGEPAVRAKFIDNDLINIFYIRNGYGKNTYSNFCVPLDVELPNGIPMFWDDEFNNEKNV